jgi:predicted transposase/invertase (TIGR01784 family)
MSNSNKHDEFFYKEFSNPKNTADLLRNALPVNLSQRIDYSSVKIENTRYVDDFFKDSYSDLLVSTMIDDNHCFVYFLVEHKSYPYKFTLFQLLTYIVKIWSNELRENEYKEDTKLTPIIPLIFSHARNSWKYQNDISIYFKDNVLNDAILRQFIPNFQSLLYDWKC